MENENSQNFSQENPLAAYVDILRRRRPIVVQTFIVVLATGILVTFLTKPQYETATRILVEGKAMVVNTLSPDNPLNGLIGGDSSHDVDTQLEVIQGQQVMKDAYQESGVPLNTVSTTAKQSGNTDVIDVECYSGVRDYAQRFAVALPKVYTRYVTGNRKDEIEKALAFAQNQLLGNRQRLALAENDLQKFHQNTHIMDTETEIKNRTEARVKASAEYDAAKAQTTGLQARLKDLQTQKANAKPNIVTPELETNPAIQTTKDAITAANAERTQKLLLYKPNTLEIQSIDLRIHDLEQTLKALPPMLTKVISAPNPALTAIETAIANTQSDLSEATARLNEAGRLLNANKIDMDRFGALERQQNRLQRDIAGYDETDLQLKRSIQELSLREQAQHEPVIVISPAPRAWQIAPRRFNNMLIAGVAGLILALVFALLQEFLDDGVNTPDESRRILGVPALGFIPMIEESKDVLLGTSPGGSLLETYRVLRTNVRFSAVDSPIRSIVVTSTLSGEGKSVTVHNLAVAMALDGRKVIIVDTDLRRPTQHKHAGLERSPGLTNVLVGRMDIEEALQETDIENLRVMTTGPLPPNPTELLSSQAMAKFHEEIKEHADLVIFDSPPCLVAADAQLLAAAVDGVLYVAQFGLTKKQLMRRSAELLQQAQARMLGVVFNKLDLRGRRNDYYYGYYRYYKYYRDDADSLGVEGSRRGSGSYREFEALTQNDRTAPSPVGLPEPGANQPSDATQPNTETQE